MIDVQLRKVECFGIHYTEDGWSKGWRGGRSSTGPVGSQEHKGVCTVQTRTEPRKHNQRRVRTFQENTLDVSTEK